MNEIQKTVLVVDDEPNIRELLRLYLETSNFLCIFAEDGVDAIEKVKSDKPDLVLLDIMMPNMDGWQTCKEIRQFSTIPIIMLTAKGEGFDKVLGLDLGADDYIVKPFDPKEVIARINAVLRRCDNKSDEQLSAVLEFPKLKIDINSYTLILDGKEIQPPPKEIELLHFLASNPNKVFTREQILEKVWDFDFYGDTRTVDVHMKRIREKIEIDNVPWDLKTVWGVGYKFEYNA